MWTSRAKLADIVNLSGPKCEEVCVLLGFVFGPAASEQWNEPVDPAH